MSARHFASMHAGLLARKGEAAPSAEGPAVERRAAPLAPVRSAPAAPASSKPCHGAAKRIAAPDRPVRAGVRLDREQIRRLRLAAAILGRTQQDLISEALDRHLDRLSEGALQSCACFRRR